MSFEVARQGGMERLCVPGKSVGLGKLPSEVFLVWILWRKIRGFPLETEI